MRLREVSINEKIFILILLVLSIILFLIGKNGWFLNDDFYLLDQAKTLKLLSPFYDNMFYRPIAHISFYVQQKISGLKFNHYLLLNILIHLVNAYLLYYLMIYLARNKGETFPDLTGKLLVLIFFIHPTGIEVVEWSSARTDSLAGLFVFSSIISLIKGKSNISVILYALALLSKEIAIAALLPYFIIIYYKDKTSLKKNLLKYSFVTVVYIAIRYYVLRDLFFKTIEQHILEPYQRIAHLIFYLFIPHFNYCIKLLGLITPVVLLVVFSISTILISIYIVRKNHFYLFIIAGFCGFLLFAISSYIIGLRYLYLPLFFGILLLYCMRLETKISKDNLKKINIFIVLVICLFTHLFGLQMEGFIDHGKIVKVFTSYLLSNKDIFQDEKQTVYAIDFLPVHVTHFLNNVSFSGLLRLYNFKTKKGVILYTIPKDGRLVYSSSPQAMKEIKDQEIWISPPRGYLIFFQPDGKLWKIESIIKNF